MNPVRDRVVRVSPLGVRPWDVALDRLAEPGLAVSCHGDRGRIVPAVATASGCYVMSGIPGLRPSEFPADQDSAGTGPFWYHAPVSREVRIEITDPAGRYLPIAVRATVPHRGPLIPPGSATPVVPLYSAPARALPPGCGVIRAQLELAGGGPAGRALLDVGLPGGPVARGVADELGRVAVVLSWPEPPMGAGPPARAGWPVTVAARYSGVAGGPVPELDALTAQPSVEVLDHPGAELRFGRELVLRSAGRSVLLLSGPA